MPTEDYDKITVVRVSFSEEEWAMLERLTGLSNPPTQYIHDVVVRSLRRKKPKIKKDV